MSTQSLLNMTTAFFVNEECSKEELRKKQRSERIKAFEAWLAGEGYTEIKHEYFNLYGAFYVDIGCKTYARAHADALLAPVVGAQAISYDDFKEIHCIFKRGEAEEKNNRFRPALMTPLPLYLQYEEYRKKEYEKNQQLYFDRNPSFEKWCDDVFKSIKGDQWYMIHQPDFSKELFRTYLEDKNIQREMKSLYKEKKLPGYVAANWDLITF